MSDPHRSRDDANRRVSFLTRRQCLQVGLLPAVGLGLPDLLKQRAVAETSQARRSEKSCIFIMLNGGASHIDMFDPKPEAPLEIRGPYRTISSRVPGIQLTEKLPRLAALTDKLCV